MPKQDTQETAVCSLYGLGVHGTPNLLRVGHERVKNAKLRSAAEQSSRRLMHEAFSGFFFVVKRKLRGRLIVQRSLERIENRTLSRVFLSWLELVDNQKRNDMRSTTIERDKMIKDLLEANSKLVDDNRRLARVIDTGEWAKSHVRELHEYGTCMLRASLERELRELCHLADGHFKRLLCRASELLSNGRDVLQDVMERCAAHTESSVRIT
eukprot:scaffold516_cov401-Prasinococcus_capsulatus_cf.AAC.9